MQKPQFNFYTNSKSSVSLLRHMLICHNNIILCDTWKPYVACLHICIRAPQRLYAQTCDTAISVVRKPVCIVLQHINHESSTARNVLTWYRFHWINKLNKFAYNEIFDISYWYIFKCYIVNTVFKFSQKPINIIDNIKFLYS